MKFDQQVTWLNAAGEHVGQDRHLFSLDIHLEDIDLLMSQFLAQGVQSSDLTLNYFVLRIAKISTGVIELALPIGL